MNSHHQPSQVSSTVTSTIPLLSSDNSVGVKLLRLLNIAGASCEIPNRTLTVAGDLIGVLDGAPTSTDGEHVLWLDEGNGFHVRCDLRFINHSDEPNAAYYDTLEVWALTDIAPGKRSRMTM